MAALDEEHLAQLLAALPPAPGAWVRAAQELPLARRALEEGRDPVAALREAGVEPALAEVLRRRLGW